MAAWLREAAEGTADPFLTFANSELAFEVVMGEPERLVRVTTHYRSDQKASGAGRGAPRVVNLMVSRRSLLTAAADLEAEAAAYPERPGVLEIEAEMFEHQFLAWLRASLGIVPTEHHETGNQRWTFRHRDADVACAVVSRTESRSPGISSLLRIEEREPTDFIDRVAGYFAQGAGVRRRLGDGTISAQFKSTELTRDFVAEGSLRDDAVANFGGNGGYPALQNLAAALVNTLEPPGERDSGVSICCAASTPA